MRVLGLEPRTPMAVVTEGKLSEAGRGCCVPFSEPQSYEGLDAWGRWLRTGQLVGFEYYDASDCRELYFRDEDMPGVALWTSRVPPVMAAPLPDLPALESEIDQAMQLIEADFGRRYREQAARELRERRGRGLLTDERIELPPRTKAFGFAWHGRQRSEQYVVVGGLQLVVLRRSNRLEPVCVVGDVEVRMPPYTPLGVAQLDASPGPEVIFRDHYGDSWGDSLLTVDEDGCRVVARSIGSSTA